jgi:diguanylate cyclase (GGDEF)-like protein
MGEQEKTGPELLEINAPANFPYDYSCGEIGSFFFKALRDEQKFYGRKCSKCGKVYIPPRPVCGTCYAPTREWVEVGQEGILRTWCLVNFAYEGQPKEPPYIVGVIDLDGASVGLPHFVGGVGMDNFDETAKKVRIGGRVKAVWKEKREGNILDIDYFKQINDTYGHSAGDMVLQFVASHMKQSLRSMDTAARIGGEEFAVILPECEPENAIQAAARIHGGLNPLSLSIEQHTLQVTTSVGLVWTKLSYAVSSAALLSEADRREGQGVDFSTEAASDIEGMIRQVRQDLLKKIKELIKEGSMKIKYSNAKQFVNIAVLEKNR